MAKWNDRLNEEMERQGLRWNALAKYVGVSTAATTKWKKGLTQKIEGDNLIRTAKFLNVSPDWLNGDSPVKSRISNLRLVKDSPDDDDVQIPQYQSIELAAGSGFDNSDQQNPSDYITFKRSWLRSKGLSIESLVVVYAKGDSMAERIQSGDVVLIDVSDTLLSDDCIYAFSYDGLARIKRIRLRSNGNISLVSDNDPNKDLSETIQRDTADQLEIIGKAVWVGGDLI